MTIAKGQPWGEPVPVDPALPVMRSDAEFHVWVDRHRRAGGPVPPVLLTGGDLARTCGGGRGSTGMATRVCVDLVRLQLDDRDVWMTSHAVARSSWWRGPVVLVMNAQFLGAYDVAPRSHPNDGKVDVLEVAAAMTARARWQAARRARLGTHLPHPQLAMHRYATVALHLPSRLRLRVDGLDQGHTRSLALTVEPDACQVDVA